MKRKEFIIISLIICVIGSGCGRKTNGNETLVSIGDTKITVNDFNERLENLPPKYRELIKRRRGEYIQELINDTLLYMEAKRKGLDKDKDVKKVLEEAKKKILIARLLKDEVDDTIEITDEEIAVFYNAHKDKYMTLEIMRVSHILVPTEEEGEKILEQYQQGEKFDDLARARSVDPTAQRGGDIGYFPKGQLMPEFEAACSGLKIGEVSGVVKTDLGYHLIKLTDRRPPQERPIEKVKDDIYSRLRIAKRQKTFNDLLEQLRNDTVIEINEEVLIEGPEGSNKNTGK